MRRPNRLKVRNKCGGCDVRTPGFFCNFDNATLEAFEALKTTAIYPTGRNLFVQGQASSGVYVLCQGRVKLSTYSEGGKAIILRIAEAGEILGLSSAICGIAQTATAEVIEPCQVNFVEKRAFLAFLNSFPEGGMNASRQLSHNYNAAYTQVRLLGLSNSVAEKLARLLWRWAGDAGDKGKAQFNVAFTHQEIAEMIGTSRETVTRFLNNFKERDLITVRGRKVTLKNAAYFKSLADKPGA